MYRTNYEATKRAMNDEPGVETLIANRHEIKHDLDDRS
jgi:5,6,7,8-tetrahydromethanopterin hydro-lyase